MHFCYRLLLSKCTFVSFLARTTKGTSLYSLLCQLLRCVSIFCQHHTTLLNNVRLDLVATIDIFFWKNCIDKRGYWHWQWHFFILIPGEIDNIGPWQKCTLNILEPDNIKPWQKWTLTMAEPDNIRPWQKWTLTLLNPNKNGPWQ